MDDQCKKCGSQLLSIEKDDHHLCRNCLPRAGTNVYPKKQDKQEFIYKPDNYPGPIAIDCIPSKECEEYHKGAKIQINLPSDFKLSEPLKSLKAHGLPHPY